MKFIVDGMLGKIARWLRMLGYDAKYANYESDDRILEIALDEGRILLTRDYNLFRKASLQGIKAVFVEGKTHIEKLANLSKQLNIKLEMDVNESRCPKCNSKIKPANKNEIKNKIPESTFKVYDEFWICEGCGQVYWMGSHWKKINDYLNRAKQLSS